VRNEKEGKAPFFVTNIHRAKTGLIVFTCVKREIAMFTITSV
jgi:hypothetical protein